MKKAIFAFAIAVASFAASAQTASKTQFGGGLRLGLPVGSFGDFHSFGIGAELQAEHRFSPNVSGVVSAGYTRFIGKEFLGERIEGVGLIPILAGIRVYPAPNFFIGGKVGYGILTAEGESEGAFNYEPQIGYNAQKFQLALGYNGLSEEGSTLGHLGLTAIFKFN
jgi:hypothetical protein